MASKKKNGPVGAGLTAKQMKRKKPINTDLLNKIEPITVSYTHLTLPTKA